MGSFEGELRTEAEREAFSTATYFAATEELTSPPERAYFEVLPGARLGVLHRLLGSLLREPIDGLPEPIVGSRVDANLTGVFPGLGAAGVGDVVLQSPPEDCRLVAAVAFPNVGAVLVVPLAGVYGFDRFEPVGTSELHTPGGTRRVSHPLDVTRLLEREGTACANWLGCPFRHVYYFCQLSVPESVSVLKKLWPSVPRSRLGRPVEPPADSDL